MCVCVCVCAARGVLAFGQVPALEVREGVMLVQSAAIMRYIGKHTSATCSTALYPEEAEAAAVVDALMDQEADLFAGLTVAKYPGG